MADDTAGPARPAARCDGCGRNRKVVLTRTVTGRLLCGPCQDGLDGLTAGVLAGDGDVGTAIAVHGRYRRVHR